MDFQTFSDRLAQAGACELLLKLPSEEYVPAHFHVTEVGKVSKDFVDCGGVRRSEQTCVLQTLVANDIEHRLRANKLSRILESAGQLELSEGCAVEFEIQGNTIQIFSLDGVQVDDNHMTLSLRAKQTACLAPDKCGIGDALPTLDSACCDGRGTC